MRFIFLCLFLSHCAYMIFFGEFAVGRRVGYSAQFSHFLDVGSIPDISQLIPE